MNNSDEDEGFGDDQHEERELNREGRMEAYEEPEDDGAPCCRAVVTSGDPNMHEPGCYNE